MVGRSIDQSIDRSRSINQSVGVSSILTGDPVLQDAAPSELRELSRRLLHACARVAGAAHVQELAHACHAHARSRHRRRQQSATLTSKASAALLVRVVRVVVVVAAAAAAAAAADTAVGRGDASCSEPFSHVASEGFHVAAGLELEWIPQRRRRQRRHFCFYGGSQTTRGVSWSNK
jgi:hypothetical protein